MEPQGNPDAQPERARPTWRPWVTYLLVGANVFVFLLTAWKSHTLSDQDGKVLLNWGAGVATNIWLRGEYWRLFTQMWLHANWWHIGMNMYSLWVLGPLVEMLFGRQRYLYLYLMGGLAASLVSLLFATPEQWSVGASGAVMAAFGALVCFKLIDPVRGRFLRTNGILINLALIAGMGIAFHGYVDNWAHLGGLIGGFVLAGIVGPPFQREAVWRGRGRVLVAGLLAISMVVVLMGWVDLPGRNGLPYVVARHKLSH